MHFLAFLFFSGLLGVCAVMIRNLLIEAGDKIGAALAGDYRLASPAPAQIYVARRRPVRSIYSPTRVRQRIAA